MTSTVQLEAAGEAVVGGAAAPVAGAKTKTAGKLNNLQILRAVAALLVVFAHAVHEVGDEAVRQGRAFLPTVIPGPFGVEIFFVISGFIILFISYEKFGRPGYIKTFLLNRIVRIAPLYWIFTGLWVASAVLFSGMVSHAGIDVPKLVASLFFVPWHDADKGYMPTYTLGWSLNFEMFFYAIFAVCLLFTRLRGLIVLSAVLVAMVLLRMVVNAPPIEFYGRYFVLEFVAGAWIAYAIRQKGGGWVSNIYAPTALLVAVLAVILAGGAWFGAEESTAMLVFRGLAAVAVVAAFVGAPDVSQGRGGGGPLSTLLVKIGDSSYSLYLCHPFVLGAVLLVMRKAHLGPADMPWVAVAACFFASVVAGWICHLALEKPLVTAGHRLVKTVAGS
ncbi:MAG: acyltransferase [Caulobacter sp.]|nr:acyltransferase [Caulobacter sp.]